MAADPTDDIDDREHLSWDEFGRVARDLAARVVDDGFEPDVVLAIARGGLPVAGAVAYALGVKNCFCVNVEYYTGVDERLDLPVLLAPALDPADIAGMRILVCDDVNDTGHTLQVVHDTIRSQVARVRCLVLYEKPRSITRADYVWKRTDKWINFPWSVDTPVRDADPKASAAESADARLAT